MNIKQKLSYLGAAVGLAGVLYFVDDLDHQNVLMKNDPLANATNRMLVIDQQLDEPFRFSIVKSTTPREILNPDTLARYQQLQQEYKQLERTVQELSGSAEIAAVRKYNEPLNQKLMVDLFASVGSTLVFAGSLAVLLISYSDRNKHRERKELAPPISV